MFFANHPTPTFASPLNMIQSLFKDITTIAPTIYKD
jgi:hypothetical protein